MTLMGMESGIFFAICSVVVPVSRIMESPGFIKDTANFPMLLFSMVFTPTSTTRLYSGEDIIP